MELLCHEIGNKLEWKWKLIKKLGYCYEYLH